MSYFPTAMPVELRRTYLRYRNPGDNTAMQTITLFGYRQSAKINATYSIFGKELACDDLVVFPLDENGGYVDLIGDDVLLDTGENMNLAVTATSSELGYVHAALVRKGFNTAPPASIGPGDPDTPQSP